jgi:hypothetical protein
MFQEVGFPYLLRQCFNQSYELSVTRVTRLRIECDIAFGRAVLFFLSLFVFALRALKPGAPWAHRKIGKYHAAAGKYQLEAATA